MTTPDPRELEALQTAWVERDASTDEASPVDADRVWQAVRGELPKAERRELIDRLHRDPDLALSWRLARELSRAADHAEHRTAEPAGPVSPIDNPASDEDSPGQVVAWPGRGRSARSSRGLALAAALTLAILGLHFADFGGGPGPAVDPTYRGEDQPVIEAITRDTLGSERPRLRWRGPDGVQYHVKVMTEDLRVIAEARDLDQSELALSATDLASLGDGSVLLWQVEAVWPHGETLISKTFRVTWRPHDPTPE